MAVAVAVALHWQIAWRSTVRGKAKRLWSDGCGLVAMVAMAAMVRRYPEPQRGEYLDYLFKPNFGLYADPTLCRPCADPVLRLC